LVLGLKIDEWPHVHCECGNYEAGDGTGEYAQAETSHIRMSIAAHQKTTKAGIDGNR